MAVGKNKRLTKSKKGGKKKVLDIMSRKDWYDVKAPAYFSQRNVGKTLVSRTAGTKIASDGLKGRVFDICLAELNADESTYRKIKLIAEEVQGKTILTNFHGMDFTTDKLRSLVKKWQTLIEAFADVKTTDGYTIRMFCIGFTKKRSNQISKASYAKTSQIRNIRNKMVEIMDREGRSCDLKELVGKFIPESISKEIEKACQGIYPLHDVFIRKVKVLRKPRFDMARLLEIHGDSSTAVAATDPTGAKVARDGNYVEPTPVENV